MKRLFSTLFLVLLAASVSFAQSSDLRAYGLLKGKVKRISTSGGEGVAFDKNGKVFSIRIPSISVNGGSVYGDRIDHDRKGRISYVVYKQEMGLLPSTVTYKYHSNGDLASTELSGHEWVNNYYYSNYRNGLPYTVRIDEAAEAWGQEGTLDIKYTKFDSHGNWTKCVWSGNVKETEDGGSTYVSKRLDMTITRQIYYY